MSALIRVVLVDDHAIVREGYRRLLELEPDMQLVGEYADADSACAALANGIAADVIVLDLSLPGRSGLDVLRALRADTAGPKVLVFTMHGSPGMVDQALRAGAAGFVTKASLPEVLVQAVRRVAAGEAMVLSADVQAPAVAPVPHAALSPREFEVVQQLVAGHTTERAAERLGLSAKTVANYQSSIRQKLGVQTNVELLREAQRRGWMLG